MATTNPQTEKKEEPAVIRRRARLPPPYLVPRATLRVDLGEEETTVACTLQMHRNPAYVDATGQAMRDVVLDADSNVLRVESVSVNGQDVSDFEVDDAKKHLTVKASALASAGAGGDDPFTLTTVNKQRPQDNTALEGLYKSSGNFCTQMEAEGFRRFAPHFDRPDVMSTYRTVITGDRTKYPVLLSNGNLVAAGAGDAPVDVATREYTEDGASVEEAGADAGTHWAVWDDPWPKPTYLFAVVGGQLSVLQDSFTTCTGKNIQLRIFARQEDLSKCRHAMDSLKTAMKWDEDTFGREYDLRQFNIVAVPDFNMGAMENKSLNVFNTKFVLADSATATDGDFERVAGVIAHEYFHNYSGNRVTCQDWFQLTLKEGFTVFRDQEFTSDTSSRAMARIHNVNMLRAGQFPQDDGPMAHPVRPDEVIAIDNFYSATVYNKGAEVVRMYDTLLGRPAFRRATDLYFDRHDGRAVTCDDFATAMEDANWDGLPAPVMSAVRDVPGEDEDQWVDPPFTRTDGPRPLTQFRRWYSVAGTPNLTVRTNYNREAGTYSLTFRQSVPPTNKQPEPKPALHIPVKVGLLGPDGKDLPLFLRSDPDHWAERWASRMKPVPAGAPVGGTDAGDAPDSRSVMLHVTEKEQTFVFENVHVPEAAGEGAATDEAGLPIPSEPVPSILRGFSAPVRVSVDGETRAQRLFRMAHDGDAFNRWEAANQLASEVILSRIPTPTKTSSATTVGDGDQAAQDAFVAAFKYMLSQVSLEQGKPHGVDPRLVADALAMPPYTVLMQECVSRDGCASPALVMDAKEAVKRSLASALRSELTSVYRRFTQRLQARGYTLEQSDTAERALRNVALALLTTPYRSAGTTAAASGGGAGGDASGEGELHPVGGLHPVHEARTMLARADNMTDEEAALSMLAALPEDHAGRQESMAGFYEKWSGEALVMDKWLSIQARSSAATTVRNLLEHPVFSLRNPNKVYSLLGGFAMGNPKHFHDPAGSGYDLLADVLKQLDPINPQVAARLAGAFTTVRQLTPELQTELRARVNRLLEKGGLSENLYEILKSTATAK